MKFGRGGVQTFYLFIYQMELTSSVALKRRGREKENVVLVRLQCLLTELVIGILASLGFGLVVSLY